MTSQRLFQYSLALPLIPPMLVLPLWFVRESINENSLPALALIVVAYSGIVGGVPYLILAGALLLWMRDKGAASIKKALLISPTLMLPVFAVCLGIYTIAFVRDPSVKEYIIGLVFSSVFIILFGYAYVGIAFGLEKLFREKLVN